MLADHAALCWLDVYRLEMLYAADTCGREFGGDGGAISVDKLDRWERVRTSGQARYLRALESLARVRRLLRLPAVQVNIAAEGGQQVNVAGGVDVSRSANDFCSPSNTWLTKCAWKNYAERYETASAHTQGSYAVPIGMNHHIIGTTPILAVLG